MSQNGVLQINGKQYITKIDDMELIRDLVIYYVCISEHWMFNISVLILVTNLGKWDLWARCSDET